MSGIERKRRPPEAAKPGGLPPGMWERAERILLSRYGPPCALLSATGEILKTSGPVSRYLANGEDAKNLVDRLPRDLRGTVTALFDRARLSPAESQRATVFIGESGRRRAIDLVAKSLDETGDKGPLLVVFEDPDWKSWVGVDNAVAPGSNDSAVLMTPAIPSAGASPVEAERILIVEDHLDLAEGVRVLLELKGYQVAVAHDGTSGIEKARQFRPAVILCDAGLKGSVDGYAVARSIRAGGGAAPALVALLSYGQEKERALAAAAGFDAVGSPGTELEFAL